jgi:hypothetical protein
MKRVETMKFFLKNLACKKSAAKQRSTIHSNLSRLIVIKTLQQILCLAPSELPPIVILLYIGIYFRFPPNERIYVPCLTHASRKLFADSYGLSISSCAES